MVINSLLLQNFRSYIRKEFNFSSGTNLLVGPNASGKTNLLEAIYLLATGKSFRAEVEEEMINYQSQIANIKGQIFDEKESKELEVILTRGEIQGRRVAKKIYKVNGINRRMIDFVGNLRVVYFGPEDLEIIVNSPATRRNYLDAVLEQVDKEYRRANLSYQKGLRQRNKLLEQIREEGRPRSILYFWDKLLISNGEIITKKREELINFINQQPEYFGKIFLEYKPSIISPQRLEKYAEKEVMAGMTLIGPHRDDFIVEIQEGKDKVRNLHIFGSRGEQRLAVFCLKLAEMEFINKKTGQLPVLLLDDIFSELDDKHRIELLKVIPRQQTIITTTDLNLVDVELRKKIFLINFNQL
ncbi:MAG: DNA replication/repair protein RecF [Microgenomates group bacterium]